MSDADNWKKDDLNSSSICSWLEKELRERKMQYPINDKIKNILSFNESSGYDIAFGEL